MRDHSITELNLLSLFRRTLLRKEQDATRLCSSTAGQHFDPVNPVNWIFPVRFLFPLHLSDGIKISAVTCLDAPGAQPASEQLQSCCLRRYIRLALCWPSVLEEEAWTIGVKFIHGLVMFRWTYSVSSKICDLNKHRDAGCSLSNWNKQHCSNMNQYHVFDDETPLHKLVTMTHTDCLNNNGMDGHMEGKNSFTTSSIRSSESVESETHSKPYEG